MSRVITFVSVALVAAAVAVPIAQSQTGSSRPKVDPLAVSYLQGQGYTPAQITAWTVGACSHASKPAACFGPTRGADLSRPTVDPLAVGYLIGQGLSPNEVKSWTVGPCSHQSKPASCYAAFDHGTSASTPTVSSVSSDSFSWGDAGVGAGAAVGTLLLLGGMSAGFVISRQHRRRQAASV